MDGLNPAFDPALLSRVEDAGLNASAPPQQRWLDGWLLRTSPGKAKRARCVNALAAGVRPALDKLAEVKALFEEAGLPLFVRITPFTQPPELDTLLAGRGWAVVDDTRVMVCASLEGLPGADVPDGVNETRAGPEDYARAVGQLRGSSAMEIAAHAQRLALSPVPYVGLVWQRGADTVACGQFACEGRLAGLYDVFTTPQARGAGLARGVCSRLLERAREQGAASAYLQVEAANSSARALYHRLGFADGYSYHYRYMEACPH
jgi:ribosomal protein S18 acetylase RimI-like enzyme